MNNDYNYDSLLTAVVSKVTAGSLSVVGGEEITIEGTGLTSENSDPVTVTISGNPCTVTSSNSSRIVCSSPRHTPGEKTITVFIPGKGNAKFTTGKTVTYVLGVNCIKPLQGSVMGGTILTVSGEGFSSAMYDNQIKVGGKVCEVISASNTEIKCLTPDTGKMIKIDNSGRHEGNNLITTVLAINWSSRALKSLMTWIFETTAEGLPQPSG